MKKRVLPSQRISKEIQRLIEGLSTEGDNQEILGRLVELGIRKVVQELLEQEVEEYLGRGHYERHRGEDHRGYRNGYKPGKLRTAEGKVSIDKPQVRDGPDLYCSRVWPEVKGNTDALERIAVEMYARGCSTRDIEELLKDEDGGLLLSRSSISSLSERLWEDYERFCKEDLSGYDVVYLFADAVYESMRLHKTAKEGILVVWGILSDGSKVLLGMKLGNKESYEDWLELFRSLISRGLRESVLGTTDGAPGLIRAFEECFPRSLRQRCVVHKKRNILGKVPRGVAAQVKAYLDAVYYAPDLDSAKAMASGFVDRYESVYPSAVKCFQDDLDACLNHLLCPVRHRRSISSTNLLERTFLEERRRSKVLARFFDEKSCLKLAFGSLMRASQGWRRIPMSFEEQLELIELRNRLGQRLGEAGGSSRTMSPVSRTRRKRSRWTGKQQEAVTVKR